ncbi:alpha/beta-hydrolase [Camillea tinctor]|nr:alpha/beta-hydrolase [Camillea tinctor]
MHKLFPSSPFFDFETIRILGTTAYGGADVAEVLEAVGQIKPNDPTSWATAWTTQAERATRLAEEARASGHRDAARRAYLRASNYTRASGYMYVSSRAPDGGTLAQDPRALPAAERVGALFREAVRLNDPDAHGEMRLLPVPFEDYVLPAYLHLPPRGRRVPGGVPVLLNTGGADSCQEELFYLNPAAGPGLGYAVLTFDGPGQGIMLRKYGLEMRPDWEAVTARVIDRLEVFARENPKLELDLERIAVSGASMGGYYALRAASDPRVKACVAIDPFYDMWDFGTAHVSPLFINAWTSGWLGSGTVDRLMGIVSRLSFQMKWEISVAGTFFGLSSPSAILLNMKNYTLRGSDGDIDSGGESVSFLSRVKCPVLLSGAGKSLYLDVDNHTKRCYDALTSVAPENKKLWIPESEGQGSLQAKMGAFALCNQRTYQFLDEVFGVVRKPL